MMGYGRGGSGSLPQNNKKESIQRSEPGFEKQMKKDKTAYKKREMATGDCEMNKLNTLLMDMLV